MTMPRFENKYRIHEDVAMEIERVAGFHIETDKHSQSGAYPVNSLYFDTPGNDDARETDDGIVMRSKVRLRCYALEPKPPFFLELKQRFGSSIYKTRVRLDPDDAERMACGLPPVTTYQRSSARQELDSIREVIDRRQMTPRAWVRYQRRAWTSSWGDGARMTIDRAVETQMLEHCATTGLGAGGWMFAESDPRAVLELKFFGSAPRWMQSLAYDFELERTSCSKYGMSLCLVESGPMISGQVQAS